VHTVSLQGGNRCSQCLEDTACLFCVSPKQGACTRGGGRGAGGDEERETERETERQRQTENFSFFFSLWRCMLAFSLSLSLSLSLSRRRRWMTGVQSPLKTRAWASTKRAGHDDERVKVVGGGAGREGERVRQGGRESK
jgi:hypothetical protein